ncbi:hypothetical protein BN2475_920009 [Paraburkholderia ribeironis]|uniref:Uncharacterized protein n=1 Tax=Paraburkholderia ribeironis TaxID=1247936 RepID=A0A1N7SL55_9BURK|nr:hypothetical protein BN2475_920009 [Paraburkholderia ribeironis]
MLHCSAGRRSTFIALREQPVSRRVTLTKSLCVPALNVRTWTKD